jgi:7-cyano-7-deazaguanine synthase
LSPVDGLHCGKCNKCAERRNGFRTAHCFDPTNYAAASPDGLE